MYHQLRAVIKVFVILCARILDWSYSCLHCPVAVAVAIDNDKKAKLWYIKKRNVSKEWCVVILFVFFRLYIVWLSLGSRSICLESRVLLALDSHFIAYELFFRLDFLIRLLVAREIDGMALILRRLICWMSLLFLPLYLSCFFFG